MNNKFKKAGAAVLSAAMLMSLTAFSASAEGSSTTYPYAPTSGMSEDASILKGATAAAETGLLNILGLNCVSSDAAGIYNGDGQTPTNLIVFGSDLNTSPDPYMYNFYKNLNATQSGGGTYSVTDYAAWTATPYALIWNNKSGPTGSASAGNTTTVTINGVSKICNPIFYYEPEILLGSTTTSYDAGLAEYQAAYNASYNPLVIGGWGTNAGQYVVSGARSDGKGLEYNTFEMCEGIITIATAIEGYLANTDKTTRYDESPLEIAEAYEAFNRGLYYYAQSQFAASNGLTKINYCSGLTVVTTTTENEDGTTTTTTQYIVTKGTDRLSQYAAGLGNDIYDLLAADSTRTLVTVETGSTGGNDGPGNGSQGPGNGSQGPGNGSQGPGSGSQGPGSGGPGSGGPGGPGNSGGSSSVTGYALTLDELVSLLNAPTATNANAKGVVIGNVSDATVKTALANAGIRILSKLPTSIYGTTMQAPDNGLGLPYTLAYFYGSQNSSLNVTHMTAYWAEKFYHIDTELNEDVDEDRTPLEIVVEDIMMDATYEATDGAPTDAQQEAAMDTYSASAIDSLITAGTNYYLTNTSVVKDWTTVNNAVSDAA